MHIRVLKGDNASSYVLLHILLSCLKSRVLLFKDQGEGFELFGELETVKKSRFGL